MSVVAAVRRHAGKVEGVSLAVGLAALVVLGRALPLEELARELLAYVDALGPWGPVLFGAVYALATVFMVPGLILSIAAGAAFGPVVGLVTISVASTSGFAGAFLIARYAARDRVAALARRSRHFGAVDRAVGEGGWKVVALLRLSPVVPFNLQNYLYGLTRLRFGPAVLASWLAMLPGTFMYVYVGHVAGTAFGERGRTLPEWVALGLGLVATVAATVYVARLARRRLAEGTDVVDAAEEEEEAVTNTEAERGLPWGAVAYPAGALVLATLAACATLAPGLFGPPPVEMAESYAGDEARATFDHAALDALLKAHVSAERGWVDYAALKEDEAELDAYLDAVADAPFEELGRDGKLALLINAYNAATLKLIVERYPLESIRDIPGGERWDAVRWEVAGATYGLNQLEHEQIRPKFAEPRIHFALVCAAVGCPPLRNEAYTADRLDEQLAAQAEYVHAHDTWYRYDREAGVVHLTKLYDWYGGDFEQVAGSVLAYAARFDPELKDDLAAGDGPDVEWLPYDWGLNDAAGR